MSSRVVHKFTVSLDPIALMGTQVIDIPAGADLVHCAAQRNSIALWYEVPYTSEPYDGPTEQHGFQVFGAGTGPIGNHLKHIGTALFADGDLVLHVYEVIYP